MSMMGALTEKLRRYARFTQVNYPSCSKAMLEAADAIEGLSAKVGGRVDSTEGLSAKAGMAGLEEPSIKTELPAAITAEAIQNAIEILEAQMICGEGNCEEHCGQCEYFVSLEDEVAAYAVAMTVLQWLQQNGDAFGLEEKRQGEGNTFLQEEIKNIK